MISKEQGIQKSDASDEVIYRIEIPANRYDLLCIEGLVRGLLIFLQKQAAPNYLVKPGSHKVLVKNATQIVRPFAVAAVLRDIKFTPEVYHSFIDLQDKLHQNLGRMRSIVSIGTHDLDTLEGPFTYDAQEPKDISFIPLSQTKKYSAPELMELYSKDSHLKPFLKIIKDKPVYPIFYDSKNTVMSFPPIINSDHSKITLQTKNVLIEITATDKYKASLALDTLVTMFGEYCKDKFVTESVEVEYESDGSKEVYPQLMTFKQKVDPKTVNRLLGTQLKEEEMVKLLSKMGLLAKAIGGEIEAIVPPTRQDILHACDIVEDIGIAFGFNNIEIEVPSVATIGSQLTINKVCDSVRHETARCGFTEALTFALCSHEDMERMHQPKDSLVLIANPKTTDFQVGRSTLLSGLLKTISANKKMPLPIKIFEVADVLLKDTKIEVGARNERRLAAVYLSKTPGFEHIHGLLDRIMHVLDIPFGPNGYEIEAGSDAAFFEGRCANIKVEGKKVGVMGVLHPTVISNFDLNLPASAFEVNMEILVSTHLKNNKE